MSESRDFAVPAKGIVVVDSPDSNLTDRHVAIFQRFCMGRRPDPQVDLPISDPRMSSVHAAIERKDGDRYEVHDLDSRNGTWVNGERISSTYLLEGDIIRLGRTFLAFGQVAPERSADEVLVGRSAAFCQVLSHL